MRKHTPFAAGKAVTPDEIAERIREGNQISALLLARFGEDAVLVALVAYCALGIAGDMTEEYLCRGVSCYFKEIEKVMRAMLADGRLKMDEVPRQMRKILEDKGATNGGTDSN